MPSVYSKIGNGISDQNLKKKKNISFSDTEANRTKIKARRMGNSEMVS